MRRVDLGSSTPRRQTRSAHARRLLALLAFVLMAGTSMAQTAITALSLSEATVKSVFDVTGTGFGAAKPKVFFAESGEMVKKTKLKVLSNSDTSLTVRIDKAVRGTFTVLVQPVGGVAAESVDTITIVPPTIIAVDMDVVQPGDQATATVEWPSTAKLSVALGGKKAKVLSVELAEGDDVPTSIVTFKVPNSVPNGTWAVQVTNPIGTAGSAEGIVVVGSEAAVGKAGLSVKLEGAKAFSSNKVDVTTSIEGPTTLVATQDKVTWTIELPFVVGNDLAPISYDATEAHVHFVNSKTGEEFASDSNLVVLVSAQNNSIVSGSFSGELLSVTADALGRLVSGTFTYDGSYDLVGTPGDTNTVLSPGQPAPPINVQILDVAGASGPTGDFQPGDSVAVTFRLAKDDGTLWKLDEMDLARSMISGPTNHYQRVIAQQTNVAATAVDNGDGSYTYTFPALPETYLAPYNDTASFDEDDGELTGQPLEDGTYTLALWFRWSYSVAGASHEEVGTKTLDFLIGSTPQAFSPRQVVRTENCNRCHTEIQFHGGSRRTNEMCVLCHTAGAEDRNTNGATPGATIEWKVMIHKLHNGAHLPSVLGVTTNPDGTRKYDATPEPYQLVGFGDEVTDYSEVRFPVWPNLASPMPRDAGFSLLNSGQQSLENEMRSGATNCSVCHGDPDGDDGALEAPAQGSFAFSKPTRNACGSCHDDWVHDQLYTSNLQTMPAQNDDLACTICHGASGDALAVEDAHLHPLLDPEFATGLNFTVLAISEAGAANMDGTVDPGEKVAVTFTITDAEGAEVAASGVNSHNIMISGPSENLNAVTPAWSIPSSKLTGSQPYTINVPMRVYFEQIGVATGGADVFVSDFTPHWNATSHLTVVYELTGFTGGGGSTTLAAAVNAPVNYIDVVSATNFARNDFVAIDFNGSVEYLQIQTVEGNRLWFSSPATTGYAPGPQLDHAAGMSVDEVTLAQLTSGTNYSLTAATGTVTEGGTPFGTGNRILTTYTTDLIMPTTYGLAFNAGPDLGESSGTWAGKSLVSGTYSLGMWGYIDRPLALYGETQTYRDGAGLRNEFLVGSATTLDPWDNISSQENCYACHVDIQFHGSGRRDIDSCIMCHGTAGAGDRPQYVAPNADATDGVTMNFREMLHKIHTGSDLAHAEDYKVVGFGSSAYPNNFTEYTYEHVGFPALPSGTRDCTKCHGVGSETWHAPTSREHPTEQVLAVKEWTLVCGSCHDEDVAQAHIQTQSSPINGAEACVTCHGPGQPWAVEIMHEIR